MTRSDSRRTGRASRRRWSHRKRLPLEKCENCEENGLEEIWRESELGFCYGELEVSGFPLNSFRIFLFFYFWHFNILFVINIF